MTKLNITLSKFLKTWLDPFKTALLMPSEWFLLLMLICIPRISATTALGMEYQLLEVCRVYIDFCQDRLVRNMIMTKILKAGWWWGSLRLPLMRSDICMAMVTASSISALWWEPWVSNKQTRTQSHSALSATESCGNAWNSITSQDTRHLKNAQKSWELPSTSHNLMSRTSWLWHSGLSRGTLTWIIK